MRSDMMVQFFTSLAQFYRRYYSKLRMFELIFIVSNNFIMSISEFLFSSTCGAIVTIKDIITVQQGKIRCKKVKTICEINEK